MSTRAPSVTTIYSSSPTYNGYVYCITGGCHGVHVSFHLEQEDAERLYRRLGAALKREEPPKAESA